MSKDLPSIDDFEGDNNLPSIDDYINEESVNNLPSVEDFEEEKNLPLLEEISLVEELPSIEDFIVEEEIEEESQTIEDVEGNTFAEIKDIVPPWPELVKMINDVREEIPNIPEIKYYDKELEELAEQIVNLPEVRYYDREIEVICEQIDLVREQVKDLPEVKYYDEQVNAIEERIKNLPEIKHYDSEIVAICEAIDAVKATIPNSSLIDENFSFIEEDFVKVNDAIDGLRGKIEFDLERLSEDIDVKYFNNSVKIDSDIKELDDKLNILVKEEKDKIWKELQDSSAKIWEYHKEFKDDDRKLKKQILGEYNKLKKNIEERLEEVSQESIKTDELLLKYFTELREEVTNLPEVKYYDKDIDYVKSNIKGLHKIVEDIKSSQKKLQEEQKLLAETNVPLTDDPPETDNSDPLTPIDQNFVTLDQLQKHYKTFVQRVQHQLSSIGGGGETRLEFLDDIDRNTALIDGRVLQYDASAGIWTGGIGGSGGGGSQTLDDTLGLGNTSDIGMSVGVVTATSFSGDGSNLTGIVTSIVAGTNVTISGSAGRVTINSHGGGGSQDLDHTLSLGNISGIGMSVGVVTATKLHVGVDTGFFTEDLVVNGDTRVTGILTIGTASVTLDGVNETVQVGSALTLGHSVGLQFHTQSIHVDGFEALNINSSGVVTATTFEGSLATSNLTGTISNDQLGGSSIENSKLSNSTVSYGGVQLSLGGSDATPAFDLSDATNYPYSSLTGITTDIVGDTTPQLGGNLDVNGNSITGTGNVNLSGIITASSANFSGNVSIGGTLTYEDVTNIDSVGLITARTGIDVLAGGINAVGVVTATSFDGSLATTDLTGTITNAQLAGSIENSKLSNSTVSYGGVQLSLGGSDATPAFDLSDATNYPYSSLTGISTNIVGDTTPQLGGNLDVNSNDITGTGNVNLTGVVTATTFSGSGASLTNIPNSSLDNSSVSYGGVQLSLGGSDSTPAFDLSDATNYPYSSLTGISTNIIGDTTPQLGGNLDVNGNDITGTGNVNLSGIITATTFSGNLPTTDLTGTITNAQLAGSIENSKLSNSTVSYGGISLSLGGSDATPAFDLSDATNYPTSSLIGTITNAQLAGSIENSKLSNSTVSYGGIQLSLGGSDATPAFDLSDATNYPYDSLTGITTNIVGDTTPQLGGNLDVNGNDITGTGDINLTGIITGTSFSGSGTDLTGIVTSITAGNNISISAATGNVTITGLAATANINADTVDTGSLSVTGITTLAGNTNITGDITSNVTIVSTDTGSSAAPEFTLYRNSASPAPGDYLGQIMFKGENSNGGQENYAKITAKISDETLGTEDGLIETAIKGDGSFTIVSRQRSDELQLINGVGLDVDGTSTFGNTVTVNADISNTGTAIFGSSSGVGTVSVGVGTTALLVEGDTRITGILTVGTSSLTLDGSDETIQVGSALTLGHSIGLQFHTQSIHVDGFEALNINSSGVVTATTFSGSLPTTDLTGTITNAQLAGSIENSKLSNSTVSYGGVQLSLGGSDSTPAFDLSDATNYPTSSLSGTITNAQLAGSIENSKLSNSTVSYGGVSLSLGGSDATPAFDLSDATNYPTSSLSGTITNAQLAGSIANGKLANSTVSYGGVSLSLGGSDATPAFDLSDATNYPYDSLTGITTSIVGDTSPQLGGNLDLNSNDITGTGDINITGDISATTVSIAGTLTYEDVTNIDSVGLITARTGIRVTNGGLVVTSGVSTFNDSIYVERGTYDAGNDSVTDAAIVVEEEGTIYTKDGTYLRNLIQKKSDIINIGQQNTSLIDGIHLKPGTAGGQVKLHAGASSDNVKLETNGSGVVVTGVCTATSFVGTASTATTVTVTPNGDNATYRVPFTSGVTGDISLYTDTSDGMTYNPSTNTLVAGYFSGNGSNLTSVDADTVDGLQGTKIYEASSTIQSNLDTYYTSSVFSYSNTTTGRPSSYGMGLAFVSNAKTYNGTNNWITQLAFSTGVTEGPYFRTKVNAGSWSGWTEIWNAANDGAGSGLDADTLDGVQGSSFLRSDANDTVTATTTWNTASTGAITLNKTATNNYSGISWQEVGDLRWLMYVSNTADGTFNLQARKNGTNIKQVFSVTQSTGIINFNQTGATVASNTIWHAGNDGSGSGLDADTVDGIQASSFLRSDASDTTTGNITISKALPKLVLDSPSSGDGWTSQGAQISLGESGDGGSAALHLTYNGNGYAYIGMGVIPSTGIPPYSTIRFKYNANDLYFYSNPSIAGNTNWHGGNDGAGSGLDADTLDGVNSTSFLRSDAFDIFDGTTSGRYLRFQCVSGRTFNSTSGNLSPLEVFQATANTDAAMTFHIGSDFATYFGLDGTTNDLFTGGWSDGSTKHKIWHAGNDGSGSGLDADTIDGTQLSNLMTLSGTQTITGNKDFDGTLTYDLINGPNGSTRDKIRVYSNSSYAIGMQSGITFGGLGDWGMTFQFNDDNDRGFWWGDTTHSTAQGAMALTTNGKLTVAHSLRIGYGESDTTTPGATHRLDVSGSANFSNGNDAGAIFTSSSYSDFLYIGGWSTTNSNNIHRIRTSTNLHIDSSSDSHILVQWYSGRETKYNGPIRMNDNKPIYIGSSADYRIWHDGTNNIFRNYNHGAGNTYHQGENTSGTNQTTILEMYNTARTYVRLYENSGERLRTTSGGVQIYGALTATGDVTAFSDINLKEDIEVIPDALDKVSRIRGVTFTRKDLDDESRKSGVIAQEVEKVLPEVVSTTEDGTKTVAYGNMVGLLIEAVKEQKEIIKDQQKQIDDLRKRINENL